MTAASQRDVSVDDLIFLRRNPQYLTPHQMEALKTSIKRDGFLAPILARPKGSKFEILSGNHRAMAAMELGMKSIPAMVAKLTDDQAKRLALNLNTVHGDPTAELLAPFLAEFDKELLATVHLDEAMRKEITLLDADMADMFAKMEVPNGWNKNSVNTEIRQCSCPKCGRRHIRAAASSPWKTGRVRAGKAAAKPGEASGVHRKGHAAKKRASGRAAVRADKRAGRGGSADRDP